MKRVNKRSTEFMELLQKFIRIGGPLIASLFSVFMFFSPASSASLWPSDNEGGIYSEHKAVQVGDVVTILIVENVSAVQKTKTKTSRANQLDVKGGTGPLSVIKATSADTSSDFSGEGEVGGSGKLTAKMTAVVVARLPNGNLVLEGTRRVEVNNETQDLKLVGTIRPEDISSDNTCYSYSLADCKITYKGSGSSARTARPGLLNRLANWIF